jgi:DNA-binding NarL/FixJ family response regulator
VRPEAASDTAKPRLILVDDHRMIVDGLRSTLRATYDIVGVAFGGKELLALLKTRSADCLLLDLQLPDRLGLDLIPDVLALRPEMRILVVTMFLDRCIADAALAAGAHGFIPKDADRKELKRAIADVLAGERHVSPRVPRTSNRRTSLEALHPALQRLTPHQQTVFRLLGDGKSETEIAHSLGVGPSIVTFHKQRIQKTPGLDTRASLVRFAVLVRGCLGEDSATDRR